MTGKKMKSWVLALSLAGMGWAAPAARADVITFTGVPTGNFLGPFTEGNFTYNTLSGELFASVSGNPIDMEGTFGVGGILRIVRNNGGLFTFDGADVAQVRLNATPVRFRGVLNGNLQSAVDLTTTSSDFDFAGGSQGSGLLSGISIDELLVELDSPLPRSLFVAELVDNIRVTLVPGPAPLALLVLALAALGLRRRKQ